MRHGTKKGQTGENTTSNDGDSEWEGTMRHDFVDVKPFVKAPHGDARPVFWYSRTCPRGAQPGGATERGSYWILKSIKIPF